MEAEHTPETAVAVYTTLADAEAALQELESSGVPYPDIRLAALLSRELDQRAIGERAGLGGAAPPGHLWSLTVVLYPHWRDKAMHILGKHQPFAIGTVPAPDHGRDDTDRGAIAWRHYVFETDAATDAVGERAGTTGTTGAISSGAFASGAKAEGNPPAKGAPADDQRPPDQQQRPTGDTMRSDTSSDRSRPETELKPPDKAP